MRRLYLHVGKHKTGTTSIQRYTEIHEDFFREQGVCPVRKTIVPAEGQNPLMNCAVAAHIAIRGELQTPMRLRGIVDVPDEQSRRDAAVRLNEALHGLDGNALLMSAEAFSFMRTAQERSYLDLMLADFDVRPVLVLRDPADWLVSWSKQTKRLERNFPPLQREGTIFDFSPESWLVDDQAIESVFGPATKTISYEDALRRDGSVIPSYLEAIGIDPGTAPAWDDVWHNRSR